LSIESQIQIHTVKKVNLKGGTLFDGFPCGGLTNSIASMCFMNSVLNDLVSVMDSPSFSPTSMVYEGIGNFPTRIYANENLKVAFLISELKVDTSFYYYVSRTISRWARENGCELVISAGQHLMKNQTVHKRDMQLIVYTEWQARKGLETKLETLR
jgi:uncharacterized protein